MDQLLTHDTHLIVRICRYLTSLDVFKLLSINRPWYYCLRADIFNNSCVDSRDKDDPVPHLNILYCSLEESLVNNDKIRYRWLSPQAAIRNRTRGRSLAHLILDHRFHRLSRRTQYRVLWNLNFVETINVASSFFECLCKYCRNSSMEKISATSPKWATSRNTTQQTPAVFAAFDFVNTSMDVTGDDSQVLGNSQDPSPASLSSRISISSTDPLNSTNIGLPSSRGTSPGGAANIESEVNTNERQDSHYNEIGISTIDEQIIPAPNDNGMSMYAENGLPIYQSPQTTYFVRSPVASNLLPQTPMLLSPIVRSPLVRSPVIVTPILQSPAVVNFSPIGLEISPLMNRSLLQGSPSGASEIVSSRPSLIGVPRGSVDPSTGVAKTKSTSIVEDFRRIRMRHAFERLTLVFQIAYRNRCTMKFMEVEGPGCNASTALMSDDQLPTLPFPLRPKSPGGVGTSPRFPLLERVLFGSTIDCRYIVPFLDYSEFDRLRVMGIGRLVAEYVITAPQFGSRSTVVFAPQDIFNQTSFQSAPHLPAIYNGAIDKNLKFQGRGVFVCDEYKYEGSFKDGVNNGFGYMKSSAGEVYLGEWRNGQRNGRGKVLQMTGDSLSGVWINDALSGFGSLETKEGLSYIGNWINSKFEGWGTIWYNGILLCYGNFSRGFICGWCRIVRFDEVKKGLEWEECEYDDNGRLQRCYQIILSLPKCQLVIDTLRFGRGKGPNMNWMKDVYNKLYQQRLLNAAKEYKSSERGIYDKEKSHLFGPFTHDFPDEEEGFSSRHSTPKISERVFSSPTNSIGSVASPASRAETGLSVPRFSSPVVRQRNDTATVVVPHNSIKSRAALVQIIDTIEKINIACDEERATTAEEENYTAFDATAAWDSFTLWDKTFYYKVHLDWLESKAGQRTSPLAVPYPEDAPKWLKAKLWQYYNYPHLAVVGTGPENPRTP